MRACGVKIASKLEVGKLNRCCVLSQRVIVIGRYIKADKGIADKSCLKIKIF